MIKVRLYSAGADDICEILESGLTNQKNVEEWIMEQFPTIQFDCMDFPYDLVCCYDCYFKSERENQDANELYHLLKHRLKGMEGVLFSVFLVDKQLNDIVEIEPGGV